jgi:hypothetical protein
VKAFGISGGGSRFGRLFMSHPPLDERIETLRTGAVPSGLRTGYCRDHAPPARAENVQAGVKSTASVLSGR